MNFDTETAARYAGEKLALMLERVQRDSTEVIQKNDLPTAVTHFAELSDAVDNLRAMTSALKKHVDSLSYEILPTMFQNQGVKTISLPDIGRVTVNVRWTAKTLDMQKAMEWARETGNSGLVIETINSGTLRSFASEETLAGRPLPDDIFQVGTAQHMSITKE